MAIKIGTHGDDNIEGTSGRDVIITKRGDDVVDAGAGNDIVITGKGDDVVTTGEGNDLVIAGKGDDTVYSTSGNDFVFLGKGDDVVVTNLASAIEESTSSSCIKGDIYLGGRGEDTLVVDLAGIADPTAYKNAFIYAFNKYENSRRRGFFDLGKAVKKYFADNNMELSANFRMRIHSFENISFINENSDPVAINDDIATDEDAAITYNVLSNDSDVNGDALVVSGKTNGANGVVSINTDNTVTYTPNANFNGSDSFTYTITDGRGGVATATVNVTVAPVNDNPVAVDDSVSVNEDSSVTYNVLANDTDLDGDTLVINSVTQGSNGSAQIVGDQITYTPNANFNGTDSFTYTISDGNGGTDTATVSVTVDSVNDNPVAVDDSVTTNEDTAITINVLANDTDLDGDTLVVNSVTNGTNGSAQILGNQITYTPDANFNGTDSFTYTISDGNGGTDTATVSVIVNPVNDAPEAGDDTYSVNEDGTLVVSAGDGLLANDEDADADTLTVELVNAPSSGTLELSTDGSFVYIPNPNFNGTDSFTYYANDGTTNSVVPATVTINVTSVNDAPVAVDDGGVTTNEDTAITINVLENDTDLDGDGLVISTVTQGINGSTQIVGNQITYTPDANFNGTDSFTYTISDGQGGTDTATVSVTVDPVNNAPVANNDSYSTDEDIPITISASSLLANDTDVDGDTLTVATYTQPANGTVFLNQEGSFIYTPNANFIGVDSFTYKANDGTIDSDPATVKIVVNPVNDAPEVSGSVGFTMNEDGSLVITEAQLLANASDVDGDHLSVVDLRAGGGGILTDNGDGTWTFNPEADFSNHSVILNYAVDDGITSTQAIGFITVNPVNDAPVANNDSYSTNEDTPITISASSLLANDTDVDGDILTVATYTQPANGTVFLNQEGSFIYTPNANFNGPDSFTYKANDGTIDSDPATVNITVTPADDIEAVDDIVTTSEDTPIDIDVFSNDLNPNNSTISIDIVTDPLHGVLTETSYGVFTYTPDPNYNGADSFEYRIGDDNSNEDIGLVDITVIPAIEAVDDIVTTSEDTPIDIDVFSNDLNPNNSTISIDIVTDPLHGVLTETSYGVFTYTPDPNYNGADSFEYRIGDDSSNEDIGLVNITVTPDNDSPVANAGVDQAVDEHNVVTLDATGSNDDEGIASYNWTQTGGPLVNLSNPSAEQPIFTAPSVGPGGESLTFQLTVTDDEGLQSTDEVIVNVGNVNEAPIADAGVDQTVNENASVTLNGIGSSDDVGIASYNWTQIGGSPVNLSNPSAEQPIFTAPNVGPGGESLTFQLTVTDAEGLQSTDNVVVNVGNVNDAPVAVDDGPITATSGPYGGTPITINVLGNDYDTDGDPLTVTIDSDPSNGSALVNQDGTITYTANSAGPEYYGTDSFTYEVSDGQGGTDTATVTVNVEPNQEPVAVDDVYETNAGLLLVIPAPGLLANDYDPDGDALTIDPVISTPPVNGSVSIDYDNGAFTYTPNPGFVGEDSFTYAITDTADGGGSGFSSATVTINVLPNNPPVAVHDSFTTTSTEIVTGNVLSNDNDVDGDQLMVTAVNGWANVGQQIDLAKGGSLILNADGTFAYTPIEAIYDYTDIFTYTVSDGYGGSDIATVTINVEAPNTPPVAQNDNATTTENTPVDISVLSNDADFDGDLLSVVGVTDGSNGVVVTNGSNVTYTPNSGFVGDDDFTYSIDDGNGGTDTATVNVTVNPGDDTGDGTGGGTLPPPPPPPGGGTGGGTLPPPPVDEGASDDSSDTLPPSPGGGEGELAEDVTADSTTFVFNSGSLGGDDSHIAGFDENDVIELDSVFDGSIPATGSDGSYTVADLEGYIIAEHDGANTIITIDTDGAGSDVGAVHNIILENVNTNVEELLQNNQINIIA